MVPNAVKHGEKIGPCCHQGRAVFDLNAADGDAGHGCRFVPPGQNFRVWASFRGLRRRWVEGTEGDVIGTGIGSLDRQMTGIMAGHAEDGPVSEGGARVGTCAVLLADMGPVRAHFLCQFGPVVDQQGHVARVADGEKGFRRDADCICEGRSLRCRFQAQLNTGDIAAVQGFGQGFGEFFWIDLWRR